VANRTDEVPELDAEHQLALFGDVPAASALARAEPSVDGEDSRRSNGHHARLTLGEAARIIREAVKDKSYRSTPLGQLVGRYLRWFRNEYGATQSTLRDYEAVLAWMSITLADKEPDRRLHRRPARRHRPLGRALATNAPEGHLRRARFLELGRGAGPHRDLAGGADQAPAR
jgi:hypothetical protein